MISTHTNTITKTFNRLNLLKIQFDLVLRCLNVPKKTLELYQNLIDKRWLKQISFYALDSNNDCQAKIDLVIDWNELDRHIFTVRSLQRGEAWTNEIVPELKSIVDRFYDFASRNSLSIEHQFCYRDEVDLKRANQELGLECSKKIIWKESSVEHWGQEISEMMSSFKYIDEETFGAWSDERTEQEIIQEIYESRDSSIKP